MKFSLTSLITAGVAPLPSSAKKATSTFNFVYSGCGLHHLVSGISCNLVTAFWKVVAIDIIDMGHLPPISIVDYFLDS